MEGNELNIGVFVRRFIFVKSKSTSSLHGSVFLGGLTVYNYGFY